MLNFPFFCVPIKVAILLGTLPILIYANASTGTDAGYSGVPGEQGSCAACHSSGSGFGSVKVVFANGLTYMPNSKQHLSVIVTDSQQASWGFQLTARQASDSTAQAGSFTPGADGYTGVVCGQTSFKNESFGTPCPSAQPLQYIEHTPQGTLFGQKSPVMYQFDWTPPSSDVGDIVVYVSAVAGNGSDSTGGSHVYNQRYTLTRAQPNQPILSQGGTLSSATNQLNIAPGSLVSIYGANLSNTTGSVGSGDIVNGQLPTQLAGVSVTIHNVPAYLLYVSPTQINLVAPADTVSAAGIPVTAQVTNNGSSSNNTDAVTLQQFAPGLFLWSGKYAVATRPDFSLVGPANLFPNLTTTPAQPGDVIILFGTGLGPTRPAVQPGSLTPADQTYNVALLPTVLINNIQAQVIAAALAPGFAGLYQIAIVVPTSIRDGDQPIVVRSGTAFSAAGALLTVQH